MTREGTAGHMNAVCHQCLSYTSSVRLAPHCLYNRLVISLMSQSHHIPHHSLVVNDAEKLDHTISLATRMMSQCVYVYYCISSN